MYINYLKDLLRFESLTPQSKGAIEYIDDLLKKHGFKTEIKIFDEIEEQVTNLYAVYGNGKPNICFVGHVDVVPSGNHELWHNADPFTAYTKEGKIYGRGAVDMKGAIACFLAAGLDFIKNNTDFKGSLSFLLTSDEEGKAKHGTKEMLQYIYGHGHKIDFAIVGEPSCEKEIGDTIKIGRRGSVNFKLSIEGLSGHVAYPQKAKNPLPCLIKILNELTNIKLDEGTEFFQNSNLEVTNIDVGNNTLNVIPASVEASFNIRFNNLHNAETLAKQVEEIIKRHCKEYKVDYELEYSSSAESFIQNPNDKIDLLHNVANKEEFKGDTERSTAAYTLVCEDASTGSTSKLPLEASYARGLIKEFAKVVEQTLKIKPELSTSGGTSDARFVKDYCSLVEFGLLSETAHKINEYTKISDLQKLYDVYYNFLIESL